jgi:hypothetical protein
MNIRAFVMHYSSMLHRFLRHGGLLTWVLVLPPWAGPACAALGGDAAGVFADASAWHGAVDTRDLQQYEIRDIAAAAGTHVREYLNRDGVVFAVGWNGPVLPDLQRLLGEHFKEYAAALAALKHLGLARAIRIASPGLVVESGGHLRAYAGRAYLPDLLPAGVPMADLH